MKTAKMFVLTLNTNTMKGYLVRIDTATNYFNRFEIDASRFRWLLRYFQNAEDISSDGFRTLVVAKPATC